MQTRGMIISLGSPLKMFIPETNFTFKVDGEEKSECLMSGNYSFAEIKEIIDSFFEIYNLQTKMVGGNFVLHDQGDVIKNLQYNGESAEKKGRFWLLNFISPTDIKFVISPLNQYIFTDGSKQKEIFVDYYTNKVSPSGFSMSGPFFDRKDFLKWEAEIDEKNIPDFKINIWL